MAATTIQSSSTNATYSSFLESVENLKDLDYLEQLLSSDLQFRQDVVGSINKSSNLI